MTKALLPLALPPLVLLALSACDSGPSPTAGGVTPDEARALEEAAEMVESRRLPEAVISPVPLNQTSEATAPQE
jgi:hypothetical protein